MILFVERSLNEIGFLPMPCTLYFRTTEDWSLLAVDNLRCSALFPMNSNPCICGYKFLKKTVAVKRGGRMDTGC